MVYRAARYAPWPCEPDGRSTVPDQDRAQINRVIQALEVLYEPETESSHLVQARSTRSSRPSPRDSEGTEILSPAKPPDTTGPSQPAGYGSAPNTHTGPPDALQLPKDVKPQPRNKSPRDTQPPPPPQGGKIMVMRVRIDIGHFEQSHRHTDYASSA